MIKKVDPNTTTEYNSLRVRSIRELTPSAYVLRFERNNIPFRAGQHILLGKKGELQAREYSVYSAEQDDHFEVLIKEVEEGLVSKQLKRLAPGDPVNFESPLGYFILRDEDIRDRKFLFIASGTGISPFHSFVRSYPGLDYKLLHGVRTGSETYEKQDYDSNRLIVCTSRDKNGDFHGRVTDYLRANPVKDKNTLCYFCGNCEMIHEAYDIMLQQGIPSENLFAEVYF
ncbi:MAG: FAD-binding oxidoreductase [Bacteroidales bacterium]|nr:FAD-binding oxidoreductase [Bacteroidales bacterium]